MPSFEQRSALHVIRRPSALARVTATAVASLASFAFSRKSHEHLVALTAIYCLTAFNGSSATPLRPSAFWSGEVLMFVQAHVRGHDSIFVYEMAYFISCSETIAASRHINFREVVRIHGLPSPSFIVSISLLGSLAKCFGKLLWKTEVVNRSLGDMPRKECDRLIEIIKSRVIDGSTMEEEKDGTLGGIPNRTIGDVTPELCSKAVMEAKQWLEEKKVASSSKSGMDRGTSNFALAGDLPKRGKLPVPTELQLSEFRVQKVYSLSGGSWNIQEEIRRVRSKATEDMLKTSARIDLPSYAWERKSLDEPLLADKKDWEGGAKVHNFDLFPATGSITSALELTRNISCEEDFTSQPIFSSSAQIQDLEGIQPVEGEGHAGSNSRLPTIPDPAVEHDSRTYSADKEETELRGNPNTNGFCISGSSFGAGDDEQTLRSSHDMSPKPVGSNLDNLVNIAPMEETCELLSEASMEVPVIFETNSSAAAGGSQGSCTMQCEELSHELSQPNLEDSLVGKTSTTVEKQQGRKLSSRYNRKSRGKR
ncbi:hypothetical protein RHGRI_026145 [Rhododendron griersonianum]|uniref:Uncharacterized protein n=1 Tax=Rhododendron griersonianum TaxID=479676 RepID=A0AAV6IWR8_9ERIC|nr:hypothetical protein RHGRI_026145 [Rhododendron griersonianum]